MSQSLAADEVDQILLDLAAPEAERREAAAKRIARGKSSDERVVRKLQELAASDPHAYVRESASAALLAVGQTVPVVNVRPAVNAGCDVGLGRPSFLTVGFFFFIMVACLLAWIFVSDVAIGSGREFQHVGINDLEVYQYMWLGEVGILPLAFFSGFVTQRKRALAAILVIGVLLSAGMGQFFSNVLSKDVADPYISLVSVNFLLWIPPLAWAGACALGLLLGFLVKTMLSLGWSSYVFFFVSGAAQIVWTLGGAMLDVNARVFLASAVDTFGFPLQSCYVLAFVGVAFLGLITFVGGWSRGKRDRGLAILSFVLVLLVAFNILSFFVPIFLGASMRELLGRRPPLSVLLDLVGRGLLYLYVGLAIALPIWRQIGAFRKNRNVGNSPTSTPSAQGRA